MQINDLNKNLNEGPISGPAGFAKRAKAKLQKNTPFARQQQKRGKAKEAIFKQAKDIKNELKAFMGEIGENELSITDFLDWMKNNTDSYEGTLAFANKQHSNLSFPGNEKENAPVQGEMDLEQGSDKGSSENKPKSKEIPPGKISNSPPEKVSPEDEKAGRDRINRAAEEESRQMNPDDTGIEGDGTKQDVKASKGDDKEPKVDTSASIYESRFQAMLEADQSLASSADGEISNDKLKDNQMDTLILRGLQMQRKLAKTGKVAGPKQQTADPEAEQEQQAAEPKQAAAAGKAASSGEAPSSGDGISLDKSDAKKVKALLTKAHAGSEFDDKDRKVAATVIKYLNKYV